MIKVLSITSVFVTAVVVLLAGSQFRPADGSAAQVVTLTGVNVVDFTFGGLDRVSRSSADVLNPFNDRGYFFPVTFALFSSAIIVYLAKAQNHMVGAKPVVARRSVLDVTENRATAMTRLARLVYARGRSSVTATHGRQPCNQGG